MFFPLEWLLEGVWARGNRETRTILGFLRHGFLGLFPIEKFLLSFHFSLIGEPSSVCPPGLSLLSFSFKKGRKVVGLFKKNMISRTPRPVKLILVFSGPRPSLFPPCFQPLGSGFMGLQRTAHPEASCFLPLHGHDLFF